MAYKKRKRYEGQQYRGGRVAGRKNLKKIEGGYINQHGIAFTDAEKKALENAVNAANRKRKKMLAEEARLPRRVGGVETGDTVASLQLMGRESDFILQPKTKSLQRFKSKDEYNRYMTNLQRVNSPDYIDKRIGQYKRNYMKALENEFGANSKDVVMKVRMMKRTDFMKLLQSDELLEIYYIYEESQKAARLNRIRRGFGMKEKDYNEMDNYDDIP